jgi:hypothetical protein
MTGIVGADLREKIGEPLLFQWESGGAAPLILINGFDATILIDVCKAILQADAEGRLARNQQVVARNARIILNASAKAGIKGLVPTASAEGAG